MHKRCTDINQKRVIFDKIKRGVPHGIPLFNKP